MGINDNLIEDYRSVITNTILSNETIVRVLSNNNENQNDDDDEFDYDSACESLLWTHLVPQQYIPDTITETGSYILYDLDENVIYPRNSTKGVYTELTLYIWVLTHKDMPKYKGRLRNDILSRELKAMFNETGGLGIAKNHLIHNSIYNTPNYKYMGRLLTFKITDWADKVRLDK